MRPLHGKPTRLNEVNFAPPPWAAALGIDSVR
jgi:hypothetical protein